MTNKTCPSSDEQQVEVDDRHFSVHLKAGAVARSGDGAGRTPRQRPLLLEVLKDRLSIIADLACMHSGEAHEIATRF
ncbi:MAG TPA: hypothetical protein EYO90_10045 [Candidatus Latescibacteria bacterium]|nr:hypothetical protein [Candidatus Latescibacterota bacterium]